MNPSGGYELVRFLGAGVAGSVYVARTDSGEVVMRQFDSTASPGTEAWNLERQYFLDAARRAQQLRHPNIVPVNAVIEEAGEVLLEMEYQDFPTLQALLTGYQLRQDEVHSILRKIAQALDYAHSQNVVHGDLKPSNVFVSQSAIVKVSDFGISPRSRVHSLLTLTTNAQHSYLSPEHLRGPGPLTTQSDQYSLAVMAHEMLTGQLPPRNDSGTVTPHPELSAALRDPLVRAMHQDPSQRFSSCTDFATALESAGLVDTEPGDRRRLIPLIALIAGILLAIGLGAWAWTVYGTSSQQKRVSGGQTPGGTVTPPPATPPVVAVKPKPAAKNPITKKAAKQGGGTGQHLQVDVVPPPPPPPPPAGFSIIVFSREKLVPIGIGFSAKDPTLGEMGLGDLRAVVKYEGGRLPRNKLFLQWTVDNLNMQNRAVVPDHLVEFGNEPPKGTYILTLRADREDGRALQTFTFRITP